VPRSSHVTNVPSSQCPCEPRRVHFYFCWMLCVKNDDTQSWGWPVVCRRSYTADAGKFLYIIIKTNHHRLTFFCWIQKILFYLFILFCLFVCLFVCCFEERISIFWGITARRFWLIDEHCELDLYNLCQTSTMAKVFRKCKSATFQIGSDTYTIGKRQRNVSTCFVYIVHRRSIVVP
jgi:hypothetical protein